MLDGTWPRPGGKGRDVNELNQNLLTDETILFETKKHWFSLLRDSAIAILIVLGAILARWLSPNGEGLFGWLGSALDVIANIAILVAIVWIVYNTAVYFSAHFGVTNMRVLRYEGLLRRRSSETLLTMLTDVRLTEPALGRMLGFGDLQILTASGAAGEDQFRTVEKAAALRTAIQEQKARTMTGPVAGPVAASAAPMAAQPPAAAPTPAPAPAALAADDPAARLTQLADLRDKGLITAAEYDAKKTELLGRI
jgi:Bacterial PH domain/Short C-terminal domain